MQLQVRNFAPVNKFSQRIISHTLKWHACERLETLRTERHWKLEVCYRKSLPEERSLKDVKGSRVVTQAENT